MCSANGITWLDLLYIYCSTRLRTQKHKVPSTGISIRKFRNLYEHAFTMFVADDKEKIVDRVSKTKMEGKLLL